MNEFHIETARLRLFPLAAADVDALHALCLDPEVARYMFDGERIPRDVIEEFVATSDHLFVEHRYGLWRAESKEDGGLIGFGGFWFFHEPPVCELFYGLGSAHWGRGYATELSHGVLRYGFETLAMTEVRASTDVPNVASTRVLDRLGFRLDRRSDESTWGTLHYVLPRAAWQPSAPPSMPGSAERTQN